MDAAVFRASKQAGPLQDAQVFGNCRQRHLERRSEFGDTADATREAREDGAANRIGQCGKRAIKRGMIVNHMVKYKVK